MSDQGERSRVHLRVELIERLKGADLDNLCEATELAIRSDGGFGWLKAPTREALERFWRGVLAVPERSLFVGRIDGVVAGSLQLVRPSRNNEAQAMAVLATTIFLAPWARGHGLGRLMLGALEERALVEGFAVVNMDVRESQTKAIALFESAGYKLWGVHPRYARVEGRYVPGRFYYKDLTQS